MVPADEASKRGAASGSHVASKRYVREQGDMASGVTCRRGVRELGCVLKCDGVQCPRGVRDRWHRQLASNRGVTCPRSVRGPGGVARCRCGVRTSSKSSVTCPRGVRQPGRIAGAVPAGHKTWRQNVASLAHVASESHMASPDVASKRGVGRHRPTRRRRPWRQYVASSVFKRVFSRWAICAPPQATPLDIDMLYRYR